MKADSPQIFVARQPILDRQRRLVAYELLFRGSVDANAAQIFNPSLATARVALDAFLSMGVNAVLGRHRGFLNVDLEMLASEAIEALPTDRIVLEILETTPPWALERCRELRAKGFELALDDFVFDDDRRALLSSVDYVKVDLMQTEREQLPELITEITAHGACPLAEKVETKAEFEECLTLGFELFQGYFFAKPTTLAGTRLDTERSGLLTAFRAVSDDRSVSEIEEVFKRHARLGVQLLRIANSAGLGAAQKITAFHHAIMYVGRQQLRRWLLLMLYASSETRAATDPTLELATIRGRVLELLAPLLPGAEAASATENDRAFLTGMLSLGDAIVDVKLGVLLDDLEVEPQVRSAVLERRGPLGRLLDIAEVLETDRFESLPELLDAVGLSAEQVAHAQRDAFEWSLRMGMSEVLAGPA